MTSTRRPLLSLFNTCRTARSCRQLGLHRVTVRRLALVALVILLVTSYLRSAIVLLSDSRPDDLLAASSWQPHTDEPSTVPQPPLATAEAAVGNQAEGVTGVLSLAEHADQLERRRYGDIVAADDLVTPSSAPLQHIVIITAGLDGAVLGGGIGTAYSALARRLVAFGHSVQVLYVPYPAHHSTPPVNRTELASLYSPAAIDQLLITRSACLASTLLSPFTEQQAAVRYRAVRGCSYACIRSYHVYRWLAAHLQRVSAGDGGVVVHAQDNAGLGYFVSQARIQRLLPTAITLVLGSHAPHVWERQANGAVEMRGEDAELDWMERSTAASVDWLVSPSRYMLSWMAQQGWTFPPHVAVQPNLLSHLPSAEQVEQRARYVAESRTWQPLHEIVFFGRLELRKGLFVFLDALRLLLFDDDVSGADDVSRWSAGQLLLSFLGADARSEQTGGEWASHTVRARCHELSERLIGTLDLRCALLTNLSRHASLTYLNRHPLPPPLVVIGSPIDNSPYTVLECVTLGVPFLAAAVGGIPELVHRDMLPGEAEQRLFEPTPRHLCDKLRQAAVRGVSWLPMVRRVDNERAWKRWHRALPPAADATAPAAASFSHVSLPLLAVVIVYPGSMSRLRGLLSAVLEQRGVDAFELQPIVVLVDDRVASAGSAAESDAVSGALIRSELAAVSDSTGWLTRLLTVPPAVLVDAVSYWQWAASRVDSDYYLFLDRQHTLYGHTSLSQLMHVALSSGAELSSGLVYDAVQGEVVLDLGCSRRAVVTLAEAAHYAVNRSLLVRRSVLHSEAGGKEQQRRSTAVSSACVIEPLVRYW